MGCRARILCWGVCDCVRGPATAADANGEFAGVRRAADYACGFAGAGRHYRATGGGRDADGVCAQPGPRRKRRRRAISDQREQRVWNSIQRHDERSAAIALGDRPERTARAESDPGRLFPEPAERYGGVCVLGTCGCERRVHAVRFGRIREQNLDVPLSAEYSAADLAALERAGHENYRAVFVRARVLFRSRIAAHTTRSGARVSAGTGAGCRRRLSLRCERFGRFARNSPGFAGREALDARGFERWACRALRLSVWRGGLEFAGNARNTKGVRVVLGYGFGGGGGCAGRVEGGEVHCGGAASDGNDIERSGHAALRGKFRWG